MAYKLVSGVAYLADEGDIAALIFTSPTVSESYPKKVYPAFTVLPPCDRYNKPKLYDLELPVYSSRNGYYRGVKTGDYKHDNVKQLKAAAAPMSKVGNDRASCKATVDLNSLPKGTTTWELASRSC